jgi:hypothetical protein
VPASPSLFGATAQQQAAAAGHPGKFGVLPTASPGARTGRTGLAPVKISARTATQNICVG